MHMVAERDGFTQAVASLAVNGETLVKLESFALKLFGTTDDFTALHGVTGLAAVSTLIPWVDDQELMARYASQALVAAFLSIGAPKLWSADRLDEFIATTRVQLDEIRLRAANCDDEHEAKLVYTALRAYEQSHEPLYLAVAARASIRDDTEQSRR